MPLRSLLLCVAGSWIACQASDEPAPPDAAPGEPACLDEAGVLCTVASVELPVDVAVAPDGALAVSSWRDRLLRRVDPRTGAIDVIAGNGELGEPGCAAEVGRAARDVCLQYASSVSFAPDGDMLVAGFFASQVIRIGGDGIVNGVLGTGERGFAGNGGPAVDAVFNVVSSVAPAPDGTLYVMDSQNQVIRAVDPDGVIDAHAGRCVVEWEDLGPAPCEPEEEPVACPGSDKLTCGDPAATCDHPCTPAFAGDGGPALAMRMGQPFGEAADPSGRLLLDGGTLYFGDPLNGRVRAIGPDGIVRTVIEGMTSASGLARAPDGALIVSDPYGNCIQRLAPDGALATLVGQCGSERGTAEDGTPAASAALRFPFGVALADGVLYFTDTGNGLVRAVRLE